MDEKNNNVTLTDSYKEKDKDTDPEFKGFGMWADREDMKDVDAYIRNLRKGRVFAELEPGDEGV